MLKKLLVLSLFLFSPLFSYAENVKQNPELDKLYSSLKFENDQPSYMDTIVPLSQLIGSKIPTPYVLANGKTDNEKYIDYIKDKTSFKVSTFAFKKENPFLKIGNNDFLITYVLEPKNKSLDKEKKNFSIEFENGRGKVYSITLNTSELSNYYPRSILSSSNENDFLVKMHYEYIESYLTDHQWKKTNQFFSFFNGEYTFEKDNLKLTYYAAVGYAAIIKIERTDMPELQKELDKIHEEGIAFSEKQEKERKENKFKD